jgi:hypothetical protein
MEDLALALLMYGVFPLWVAAGLADWGCHRSTGIEHTSGLHENHLHLLMFAEIGVGMAAFAWLEVNAAVLAIVAAVFAVHEFTVYRDLHYTVPVREVAPVEQMVHSVLEMLPLLSLALLCVHAWPQALAMLGLGHEAADWALRAKAQPLPRGYLVGAIAGSGLLNGVPLVEEWWRCRRVGRAR